MLLLLLGYKVRNLSKFTCFGPNLWSFLVHFSPFFAHSILRNYGKLTAENWPRDAQRIVVRFGPYQIKQYPLSTMVFASFLGVISNTDHRHFAFRTFPKLYPNFPELSRSSKPHFGSQSPGGKFHVEPVKVFVAIFMREWIKHFSTIWSERLKKVWEQLPGNSFQRTDIYRDHIWPTVATTCHDVLMFTVY